MIHCAGCRFYRPSTYEYAGASSTPLGYCEIVLPPQIKWGLNSNQNGVRHPEDYGCALGQAKGEVDLTKEGPEG